MTHPDGRAAVEGRHGVQAVPPGVLRHAPEACVPIGQSKQQADAVLTSLIHNPVEALPVGILTLSVHTQASDRIERENKCHRLTIKLDAV